MMIEAWFALGFLILLAAAGIPIMIALPFMLIMRMRLMDDIYYRPPVAPPGFSGPVKSDSWGRWRWLCRQKGVPKTADEVVFEGVRWLRPDEGSPG